MEIEHEYTAAVGVAIWIDIVAADMTQRKSAVLLAARPHEHSVTSKWTTNSMMSVMMAMVPSEDFERVGLGSQHATMTKVKCCPNCVQTALARFQATTK
jgi:hypothetical protein